jgi:solute carrier family 35 protein E3
MRADNEDLEASVPLRNLEAEEDDALDRKSEEELAPPPSKASPSTGAGRRFLIWTAINMLATIGIVFTNKAIFEDPDFKLMQTSFASFHFICTASTLFIVSRPGIGAFVPKRAAIVEILPVRTSVHTVTPFSQERKIFVNPQN